MSQPAGGLTVTIADERVDVELVGGGSWRLPLGPVALARQQLAGSDPPEPAQLTNALAAVHDHFDDVVNESPEVLGAPTVEAAGVHAEVLARVEIGADEVPSGYRLQRADAEEVFRTLVAEPRERRRFNPGLPAEHVDAIVGTCCVVLAIMRRLELGEIGIAGSAPLRNVHRAPERGNGEG